MNDKMTFDLLGIYLAKNDKLPNILELWSNIYKAVITNYNKLK